MQRETLERATGKVRRNPRGVFEKAPGSGEWWICYWDAQGRKRREKAGTKSAAIALYRKRKMEAFEGKKLPEKLRRASVLFEDIARDALEYSRREKRTYDDDLSRMARILGWFRGRAVDSIAPRDIEQRLEEGIEQGWAPSTVNHYRSLLSLCFRLAIRNDKAKENPARATRHRKEDNSRVRYLSAEEETRLRKVIAEEWPEHMPELDLALHTGLRLSEMYGLTWEHVNLPQRMLTIPRSKNGERRYIRVNSVAIAAILALQARGNGFGPVVRNLQGEPLCGPRYWFERALRTARIEGFHWHDLRHTFASRLVMAGVNLRAVQDALGHKSIAMTVRYSHLSPDYQLDVLERLVPGASAARSVEPSDTTTDTRPGSVKQSEAVYVH
jgi:site-specific recombinase XerD